MEKTFIMIKSDGVKRRLIGEIISRIEQKGLSITRAKLFKPSRALVEKHYEEHRDKVFFHELVDYILEDAVMAMEVEGENAVQIMRLIIGDKQPLLAVPGTIRGDFATSKERNVIHGSDSEEHAEKEISIWFD